jgi:hypothetical protein
MEDIISTNSLNIIKDKIIECDWNDDYENFKFDYLINNTLVSIDEIDPDNLFGFYINTMMKYGEIYKKFNYNVLVVINCDKKYSNIIKKIEKGNFYNNQFLKYMFPLIKNDKIKFVNYNEISLDLFI